MSYSSSHSIHLSDFLTWTISSGCTGSQQFSSTSRDRSSWAGTSLALWVPQIIQEVEGRQQPLHTATTSQIFSATPHVHTTILTRILLSLEPAYNICNKPRRALLIASKGFSQQATKGLLTSSQSGSHKRSQRALTAGQSGSHNRPQKGSHNSPLKVLIPI